MFVFYVDKLKNGFAGKAKGPFIFILKSHRKDKGLLAHEKVHVKQWFLHGMIIHDLLIRFSDKYKYRCEIEAYQEQIKYGSLTIDQAANFIASYYGLDVDIEDVKKDLEI